MIEKFQSKHFLSLMLFLKTHLDDDFYITENNIRKFHFTTEELKKLLNKSFTDIFILEEQGDVSGLILIWKSIGGDTKRYFVKLNAINKDIARHLLTILLWHQKQDLYIKIKKNSKFTELFKEKGFVFKGDRGKEILLFRAHVPKPKLNEQYQKQD
jgi:hypothetical protein